MAGTGTTEIGTLALGELARRRRIDSALLRRLAGSGHLTTSSPGQGTDRFPSDHPLTAEETGATGRHELVTWNEVLGNIDRIHRAHAEIDADRETFEHTAVPLERQTDLSVQSPRRAPRERPTPLADELPDAANDLSPEARRTVLDLLRVLAVAEAGGGSRRCRRRGSSGWPAARWIPVRRPLVGGDPRQGPDQQGPTDRHRADQRLAGADRCRDRGRCGRRLTSTCRKEGRRCRRR